ncbi:diguanylate cyclase domain-containing protein [Anaeroselena agilis]|uniref:Diguanylate cyclase n=1 Tax=Anaeroselena agilis TaxID=3063788 RepID=A0ABU3P1F5_9FIRM|nr:diguanylate cyclase [Selenomonadales bacterium 4137-cl]
MKVMIVGDEATTRAMLEPTLKKWGYEVAGAAGGEQALEALRTDSRPVIVLLDLVAPGPQSHDICARLKKEKNLNKAYVILLSPENCADESIRGLEAGADDHVAKPVDPAMLRSRLAVARRILECQHTLDTLTRELQAKNQELTRLGSLDGLTGIDSRARFDARLGEEWRRALRDETPLSLIILDLDFFKAYNETYGHQAGDECLKKIALTISATIARAGDLAARHGGEEFAVLLPNTDSLGALVVAEAIRVAVATLGIEHKASSIHRCLTVSAGTATIVPDELTTPAALVAKADQALYHAKQAGRNIVRQL